MNAFAPAGGAGTLSIIYEDSPDKSSVLEDIDTQSGARTTMDDVFTWIRLGNHAAKHRLF